jgi:hypothetical protein
MSVSYWGLIDISDLSITVHEINRSNNKSEVVLAADWPQKPNVASQRSIQSAIGLLLIFRWNFKVYFFFYEKNCSKYRLEMVPTAMWRHMPNLTSPLGSRQSVSC